MYSIPAPVIKTILDYCDLPSAVTFARVTKRCNTIFNQYREEILIRGEYVNLPNMFLHCSDDFIIRMKNHKFFDKNEARRYCYQKRYKLHIKLGYGKIYGYLINNEILSEIYRNGEYNEILISKNHKLNAAQLGIDLDIPYPDNNYGLHAALLLRNEKMIEKLQNYGDFLTYCSTGYYHLADNYNINYVTNCINDSHDPMAAFKYIEKRGYDFKEYQYSLIKNYEVLKLVMPRITGSYNYYIETTDFNALMLIYDTLMKFATINEFFKIIVNKNTDFTRFLLQKYNHLQHEIIIRDLYSINIIDLVDLLDNDKIMQHACRNNEYTLIRALVRRNGRPWANKYDHAFIRNN